MIQREQGERAEAREQRRVRGQPLLPVRRSTLTGFISPELRWALKLDAPKYPNYTGTSCPFVMGILLFFLNSPAVSRRTQSRQLSSTELSRPAQTAMAVLLEAGRSSVLLMALIGHCISPQLCKLYVCHGRVVWSLRWEYEIYSSYVLRVNLLFCQQRWKVTKCIYSRTLLEHFHFLLLRTATPLHFRGTYCSFLLQYTYLMAVVMSCRLKQEMN